MKAPADKRPMRYVVNDCGARIALLHEVTPEIFEDLNARVQRYAQFDDSTRRSGFAVAGSAMVHSWKFDDVICIRSEPALVHVTTTTGSFVYALPDTYSTELERWVIDGGGQVVLGGGSSSSSE